MEAALRVGRVHCREDHAPESRGLHRHWSDAAEVSFARVHPGTLDSAHTEQRGPDCCRPQGSLSAHFWTAETRSHAATGTGRARDPVAPGATRLPRNRKRMGSHTTDAARFPGP